MQSTMTDSRLSAQVRVWTDSNAAKTPCVKKRPLGKPDYVKFAIPVAAGGDQIGKDENEEDPKRANVGDHLTKGKSWREISG